MIAICRLKKFIISPAKFKIDLRNAEEVHRERGAALGLNL